MKIVEKFNKKLLVEGNDDQHVVWHICDRFKIPEMFDVIDTNGIDNLIEAVPVRFKEYGISTIGVIVDADADIKNRWASVKSLFDSQGFSLPDTVPSDGLVVENEKGIKAGVWLMPNNLSNGMLEDFISFLVPTDDKLLPIVHSTLNGIEEQNLTRYSFTHKSKAIIHTWLAWQKDPGTPLGLAITKRYLTTDEETCNKLVNWLNRLFN